jgi:hypothetical protein
VIISKFVHIADSQRPHWWIWLGNVLMLTAVVLIAGLADAAPVVALLLALPPLCAGAWAAGRGTRQAEIRSERAGKVAQIERELDIG